MQWRNGGKVPEVGKDSGRIDRSLWGRMWREKVNSWIVASSQFPRTAIIRLSLVYTLNTLLWLWTPAFSAVLHTHTHTHRGSVYACEPSVCSPRQLTGLGVRGFPLLGRSMHFLSELNSLQTGSLCQPLPSLFALYKLAEICSHKKFQGSVNPENADGGNSLTLNCACWCCCFLSIIRQNGGMFVLKTEFVLI